MLMSCRRTPNPPSPFPSPTLPLVEPEARKTKIITIIIINN
jgi:hypothetical protein